MRIYWLSLLSALMAIVLSACPAAADKRVALVIGNGGYKNTIELPNAPSDARAIAGSLRRLGFVVVEGENLTQSGMNDKLKDFSRALVGADVGMFFYAGHGLQVAGENYLVAVDAALKREGDLEFETMKVDRVLRLMQNETKIKVVILDACRDNPLAQELTRSMAQGGPGGRSRSTAVASGMSAIDTTNASGTLIAFATAPGSVALDGASKNSPFTEALLSNMETPGIDIDVMMKRVRGQVTRSTQDRQQPWTNSSLTAEFFLNPDKSAAPPLAAAGGAVVASLPQDQGQPRTTATLDARQQFEMAVWEDAKKTNTVGDYKAYLEKYPGGEFATLARSRIAAIDGGAGGGTSSPIALTDEQRTAEASEATEGKLELDSKAWREIQRRLTGLGYYSNTVDGEAGKGTRKAVQEWQNARKFTATGYLNGPQHQALLSEKVTETKTASRTKDDDEEEKPKARTRSAGSSSSGSSERRASRQGSSGGGGGGSSASGAGVGTAILGVAAGFAIGRALRR